MYHLIIELLKTGTHWGVCIGSRCDNEGFWDGRCAFRNGLHRDVFPFRNPFLNQVPINPRRDVFPANMRFGDILFC